MSMVDIKMLDITMIDITMIDKESDTEPARRDFHR
jgi:hypothetical protein